MWYDGKFPGMAEAITDVVSGYFVRSFTSDEASEIWGAANE